MSERGEAIDIKGAIVAFNQGIVSMEQGDEPAALLAWRKALELDPCLIPAALNLITYHQQRDEYPAEVALWDQVLRYDPFDTDHIILQAAAYRRMGVLDKAIENYHRAISIYPYFKFWFHELATIYEELGENEEAALWRGRGDSLGADEAEICYEDGLRHVNDCRWSSARSCFEAVLDEFPANLDARLRLARVLEDAGTEQEVVKQYKRAMQLTDAAKGLVHYRLGEFYYKRGEYGFAEREFTSALRSVPSYLKAERALYEARARRQRANQLGIGPQTPAAQAQSNARATASPPAAALQARPLLKPEEIGLEPVGKHEQPTEALSLRPPNPRLPWHQQLRQVLDQALSVPSPGGHAPRVALLVEPDQELAEAVLFTLSELRSMGRSLRADTNESHIYVLRSNSQPGQSAQSTTSTGWLGRDDGAIIDTTNWSRVRPGIPLAQLLVTIRKAATTHGFNCLLVISFGRCMQLEQDIASLLETMPLHCTCFLHPRYHYVDFRSVVAPTAHNFVDISI